MKYPILFLHYGETNWIENLERLEAHTTGITVVYGHEGIHGSHRTFAETCDAPFFFVVDADNWVLGFDFMPRFEPQPDSVYVWRARNAVNGLVYGYGGIKLLPTVATRQVGLAPDMTSSIATHYCVVDHLASETRFNTSSLEAYRSGFREGAKLARSLLEKPDAVTQHRLDVWCSQGEAQPFGREAIRGAQAGRAYGAKAANDLARINDYPWLENLHAYSGC